MKGKSVNKKAASDAALLHITTETPFNKRRDCWFCGEPNQYVFTYNNTLPAQASELNSITQLSLPSCKECYQVANKSIKSAKSEGVYYSVWAVKLAVKRYLIKNYRKDLAIGINWTKAELEESEFEEGNFAGFQRSAWFMFELAKNRVNYIGWPLVVDGVAVVDEYQESSFNFDSVAYPNIEQAIVHYAQIFSLSLGFFRSVVDIFGDKNFAKAVRFCRLLVAADAAEQQHALRQLRLGLT